MVHSIEMRNIIAIIIVLLFTAPSALEATEYNCIVDHKIDGKYIYTIERLEKEQYSVRINESGSEIFISRCSYSPSAKKITCDEYKMDEVSVDNNINAKKYYLYRSQFDVQVFFNDLSFIENNGRGSIAFGKCSLRK